MIGTDFVTNFDVKVVLTLIVVGASVFLEELAVLVDA